ncbi:MAG: hypothetical protein DHS20C18_48040 [Saprospiraceae bacterium]|nr:MAG: hypothetical protein DHS20C18_48040 [Saprospiraceae bacterium]
MKIIPILTLLSLCSCLAAPLSAQKNVQPDPEEILQAKQLKVKYEKADVVTLNNLEVYTFGFDDKNKKVTVTEDSKEKLMCIGTDYNMPIVKFYDAESSVESVEVYYKNKKQKAITPHDEYFNNSDYFYSDARVVYFGLDFPQQGFQYQVNFNKHYKDIKYFTRIYFTSPYPIQKKELQFIIPRWLDLELKEMNFKGYEINKTVTYDAKADADIYTYVATNLESQAKEEQAPGPSYLYPHLLVIAKAYEKNGQKEQLFSSTKDLYRWYKSLVDGMQDNPEVLKEKVAELTANAETDIDKLKAIYYWVQDNVRYIAFEDGIAGFQPESCQLVFKNKYGDCKGMANLTKNMLQLAGYDARLTWIGTKRIAYDYSLPSLVVDNHMICSVFLNDKHYFLDPTEKYNAFTDYAERIQGKQALIEDGDNFILANVPVMTIDNNVERIFRQLNISGETLTGNAEHTFNGESKTDLLYKVNQMETDQLQDAMKAYITLNDKNLRISNMLTSDINNRDQLFRIAYDFQQENAVSEFGDEIYLDVDYYKEFEQFKFDADRKTDYLITHKMKLEVETEIALPEGYQLSYLPKGINEKHDDFSFSVNFKTTEKKIIYHKVITLDKAVIRKKDFEHWNQCIDKLEEVYHEQIVLERKQ